MKKNFITFIAAVFLVSITATQANAQRAHEEGQINIHGGLGIFSFFGVSTSLYKSFPGFEAKTLLPIHLMGEYGIDDNWAVGLSFDRTGQKVTYQDTDFDGNTYEEGWKTTYTVIGARASYHFKGDDRSSFDPYGLGTLGYVMVNNETIGPGANFQLDGSGAYFGIGIGANYMFSEQFGGFAELGWGVTLLKIGATARF
jgi:outer membrane protein W